MQVPAPVVQWAGDGAPVDDPLREGATLVGAAVEEREDLILAVAEQGNVAPLPAHHAGPQAGYISDGTDFDPGGVLYC
jgi:hypothetical protein